MVTTQTEKKLKFIFNLLPIVGGLCLLAAMGIAIYQAQFNTLSTSLLGVGLVLFLTLFIKAEIANLKYYLHLTIYSLVVGAICVVGYLFANRYTQKLDLSEQKLYSLSEASSKYLKGLTDEVTITAFTPTPDPFEMVRRLYSSETDKLKWVFLDAVKEPLEARKMGEDVRNGEVFIASGENKKRMTAAEIMTADYENVLTNAIIDVTRKDRPKMYFIEGHGEIPYEQAPADPRSPQEPLPTAQGFRDLMAQRGIQSATLDLAKEGRVPEDASLLVLAGPRRDLYGPEARTLEEYLDKGGKLLALVDAASSRTGGEMPNLESTLEKYGLQLPNSIILDMMGQQILGSPEQPLMSSFDPTHVITRDLSKRPSRSMLGITRPVIGTSDGGFQATPLVKSSPQSWSADLVQLMQSDGKISPPVGGLSAQPIGVALSKGAPQIPNMPAPPPAEDKSGMRLVVFGSSQLIRDDFLSGNQVGVELMLNSVNWLSQREDMIAVPSKQVKGTPIILDGAKLRVIFVFSVVLIPALLFFGGVTYSVVRRRS